MQVANAAMILPVSTEDAAPAPSDTGLEADGVWAPHRRRLTLGLVLTITLVAFESLAISTVMPVVSDDLGGLGLYGWVFSGFFLGSLFGTVTAGRSADRRGTRFPFAVGLLLFSAGLLVGGLAPSMPVLVAGRVAQGIGAGAIPAVAYTSVGRAYPPPLRPRVFAVFSSAWVIPGLIGPAAAGAIEHALSWRAVFLALLPIVAVAGAMTIPQLAGEAPPPEPADPADLGNPGPAGRSADERVLALVLIAGVTACLVAVGSAPPVLAVVLGVVGVPAVVASYARLVPPGTLRVRAGMPAAVIVRAMLTFAFFGTDAYVSLTYQDVRDQPTWVAGAALTAATISWTAGAWVQERLIHRLGPRRLVGAGFLVVVVGILGMLGALGPLPVWPSIAVWGAGGFGIGMSYAPLSVTVLELAQRGREGAASASLQLSDLLGTSLGTGASGAFVALADAGDWALRSALTVAFSVTIAMALLGHLASRRLPVQLPSAAEG